MEPQPKTLTVSNPDADAPTRRKSLSKFFGVENRALSVPYAPAVSMASPIVRMKSGSKASKIQTSVDSVSLSSNSSTNSSVLVSPPLKVPSRHLSAGNINVNSSTTGLLLKTTTPNFIRKFQAGESALRKLTRKDNGYGPKRKRSRARSLSSMFERGFTLNKKEQVDETYKSSQDLSTEETAPGLLKVFGDQICPNATYKSVLASGQSSAVELVKVVLERYSLPVDTYGEYVLCDVIGKLKINPEKASRVLGITDELEEKQEWITECMRVMGDDERPLDVNSFWKPEDGFARKFEIRRRADIAAGDVDTITHGINVNAKRLQLSRARCAPASPINSSVQQNSPKIVLSSCEGEHDSEELDRILSVGQSENEETESSDEPLPTNYFLPPRNYPYLLTLQGNNLELDQILYLLDDVACLIGCLNGGNSGRDIELDSTDINQEHCRILIQHDSICKNTSTSRLCNLYIEPIGDSKVLVNGTIISQSTKLSGNDVIGLGECYIFLLKNPLMKLTNEPSRMMRLLTASNQSQPLSDPCNDSMPTYASPILAEKAQEYFANSQRLKLSYPISQEEAVLDRIAELVPALVEGKHNFVLTLSYLMGMCVEHSAYNFHQEMTKGLMLKAATMIQSLAWDKTKEIAANQQEKPTDVHAVMDSLFPDLKIIFCLLANALEVLHFLKTNMADYIMVSQQGAGHPQEGGNKEEQGDALSGVEDEAMVELEEVVMYTFQQAVYYLTKTLYIAIPNFLDSNPFSDDDGEDDDTKTKGMDSVLSVFQLTFDLMGDLDIHPQITSQLFAYLLFFTNASLFNMLVERGGNGKLYKWSKGAQMRGNLDILEAWMNDHKLEDLSKYMVRVSMGIDLLATPKVQLMQADWSTIQHDFPSLNTLQIHHILSKYQLGTSQTLPTGWLPPPETLKTASETETILESFDNHPALVLPHQGFELDLMQRINNEHFIGHLQELNRKLPFITFSIGCEDDVFDKEASSAVGSDEDKVSSSPRRSGPVPPLRTKSSKYPEKVSKEAGSDDIDILKHPLVVKQSVPIAVANTVKVPPTELGMMSEREKMSPRVFPIKPPVSIKPPIPTKPPRRKGDSSSSLKAEKSSTQPSQWQAENSVGKCLNSNNSGNNTLSSVSLTRNDDEVPHEKSETHGASTVTDGNILLQAQVEATPSVQEYFDKFEEPKKPCPTLSCTSSSSSSSSLITMETEKNASLLKRKDSLDDVFVVDLEKGKDGVGLGLIDGMHTSLQSQGIYVRKVVPDGTAMQDGRLKIGDRILAVNGTSLVGADYNTAMQVIRNSGQKLRFLVAKSEPSTAKKISASTC